MVGGIIVEVDNEAILVEEHVLLSAQQKASEKGMAWKNIPLAREAFAIREALAFTKYAYLCEPIYRLPYQKQLDDDDARFLMSKLSEEQPTTPVKTDLENAIDSIFETGQAGGQVEGQVEHEVPEDDTPPRQVVQDISADKTNPKPKDDTPDEISEDIAKQKEEEAEKKRLERRARREEAIKARREEAEKEAKLKAEQEAIAKAKAEKKAKAEAELKAKKEKAKAEAEAKLKALKEEKEAKAKAEAEAKLKAEKEEKAKKVAKVEIVEDKPTEDTSTDDGFIPFGVTVADWNAQADKIRDRWMKGEHGIHLVREAEALMEEVPDAPHRRVDPPFYEIPFSTKDRYMPKYNKNGGIERLTYTVDEYLKIENDIRARYKSGEYGESLMLEVSELLEMKPGHVITALDPKQFLNPIDNKEENIKQEVQGNDEVVDVPVVPVEAPAVPDIPVVVEKVEEPKPQPKPQPKQEPKPSEPKPSEPQLPKGTLNDAPPLASKKLNMKEFMERYKYAVTEAKTNGKSEALQEFMANAVAYAPNQKVATKLMEGIKFDS